MILCGPCVAEMAPITLATAALDLDLVVPLDPPLAALLLPLEDEVDRSPLLEVASTPRQTPAVIVEMTQSVVVLTIELVTLTPDVSKNEAMVVRAFVMTDERERFLKNPPIRYDCKALGRKAVQGLATLRGRSYEIPKIQLVERGTI